MAYVTNAEIIASLGNDKAAQLTTDSGTTPSTAEIDKARNGAEGLVNSYLLKQYTVPIDLTEHPELDETLTAFVLDISIYRLHKRRPPVPSDVRKSFEDALKWLKMVATGEIELPAAVAPQSPKGKFEGGSSDQNMSTMRDH